MAANEVNVYAPCAGPRSDVQAIMFVLNRFRNIRRIATGDVVMAYGNGDSLMPGGRTL
jgi:hypothetical protein